MGLGLVEDWVGCEPRCEALQAINNHTNERSTSHYIYKLCFHMNNKYPLITFMDL